MKPAGFPPPRGSALSGGSRDAWMELGRMIRLAWDIKWAKFCFSDG